MDELDRAILARLQHNVRQTNRELADTLGVAPSTCLARVRALRERGIIRGAHAEVDLGALGRGTQAIISLKIRPQAFGSASAFQRYVAELPETVAVFMVSGNSDFLVHVAVADTAHLREFVLTLAKRQEIADLRTSIVFEHTRKQVVEPLH
ncbi:MAG: Lrp/AsnC family transcriptional regulator [Kineosporiaceae bacterium]